MFFIKYIVLSTYRISYFIARVGSSKSVLDFTTKLRMSSTLALYLTLLILIIHRSLVKYIDLNAFIHLQRDRYIIICFYFVLCGIIFSKLNLNWIKSIQLTTKEKNISRVMLLVSLLAFIMSI